MQIQIQQIQIPIRKCVAPATLPPSPWGVLAPLPYALLSLHVITIIIIHAFYDLEFRILLNQISFL